MATLSNDVRDIIGDVFIGKGARSQDVRKDDRRGAGTLSSYVDKAVADRQPIVLHRVGQRP